MGSPAWEGGKSGVTPKAGATHSGVCLCQPSSAQPPEEEGHAPSPSLHAVMPYLVSGVRGRGLGHQQPHCGVPALSRLVVPRSHGEGHLLGGDAQLPGGEDRPVGPDLEVHAVGLIVRPLGSQAAAELDCKRKGIRSGWVGKAWRAGACSELMFSCGPGSLMWLRKRLFN